MIEILEPGWLLLLVPLLLLAREFRGGLFIRIMHVVIAATIVLALAQPRIEVESTRGKLVVVCDRSDSMPPESDRRHAELIQILQEEQPSRSDVEIVCFGRRVAIERSGGKFEEFTSVVEPSGSRLGEAITTGLSLVEPGASARVLVVSDGEVDAGALAAAGAEAATRGIAVDYRHLGRSRTGDLAIERFDVPQTVAPGESYLLTAWLESDLEQTVTYTLRRGEAVIAQGQDKALRVGRNRLTFRDVAPVQSVAREYQLEIVAQGDAVPENNVARAIVSIDGPKPLLHIAEAPSRLPEMLRGGGLRVESMTGEDLQNRGMTLQRLGGYSAVVLENTAAERLGPSGMEVLKGWVSHAGGGLWMTGGKNSFAVGGYYKSPLEEIMPVSMELRKEHRKFSVAIAVVLDRSGSMAAPAGGVGRTKMDLANQATVQTYDLLSPMDEFAAIAVDSSPHVVAKMALVDRSSGVRAKILRIESMGGGIFVYEGLKAAVRELTGATAGVKHIILFADAADSEEPGDYKKLLEACRKAGVTCSVIGLGSKSDCDARLLEDIAKRGGGRCFFSNQASDLPRLFAQDTFVVARNSFVDEPVALRVTGSLSMLTDQTLQDVPRVGGYNLCYAREDAKPAIITDDADRTPVLAGWHSGLGRVLCFTGEVDGKYSGEFGQWEEVGRLYTSIGRWTAGIDQSLPPTMVAAQRIVGERNCVRLYLDPARQTEPFTAMPVVRVLQNRQGDVPIPLTFPMRWETPDVLQADVPLSSGEVSLATVEVPGCGKPRLGPVCLPYGPEYRPRVAGEGLRNLRELAFASGGKERTDVASIWADLPARERWFSLMPWLAMAAALLLLVEVLQRRTGLLMLPIELLSRRRKEPHADAARVRDEALTDEVTRTRLQRRKLERQRAEQGTSRKEPGPVAASKPQPEDRRDRGAMLDAFKRASQQAKDRTER